jgi:hypothetical protein
MSTKSVKRRVAPLEHVVHPEGHVAQGNIRGEWHPWSTWCVLKGTSREHKRRVAPKGTGMRRVAPLEHLVRPEGHVALLMINE